MLFLASREIGIEIVDVNNNDVTVVPGSNSLIVNDLFVYGDFLLAACETSGVVIFDIKNLNDIKVNRVIKGNGFNCINVTVDEHYVYVSRYKHSITEEFDLVIYTL